VDDPAAQRGGIRRSLRSASLVSLAGGALTAFFLGSHYGALYGVYSGFTTATVLWLWYGGFTWIQHAALRALLAGEDQAYCDQRCLDAAVDRALLHRVGTGCMFLHPLFMARLAERFAAKRDPMG
jgi:hypothetical protein